jgi:flagellar biosynthesis protein FlhB
MSANDDSGDKTEKPTPKRLQEARKKGDIPKSKDITSTLGLLVWVAILSLGVPYAVDQIFELASATLRLIATPIDEWFVQIRIIGYQAFSTLGIIAALSFLPTVGLGVLIEFLQTGPVFTTDKFALNFEHLNPVAGIKKMFSVINIVELIKNLFKTALVIWIGWGIAHTFIPQLPALVHGTPKQVGFLIWKTLQHLVINVAIVSVVIALLDALWQRHSFMKKMRMSFRDIKEEMKNAEGDPVVKGQRKQLQKEWSEQGARQAAKNATALVVNPTHVAIAIQYDREACPVPLLLGKGEDDVAHIMREVAFEEGVPVVRNVELARALLTQGEVGAIVPSELFDLIAEVVLWAKEAKQEIERCRLDPWSAPHPTKAQAPGKDLTQYKKEDIQPWHSFQEQEERNLN